MFTDIKGFEGYYQIDENGVIRSADRQIRGRNNSTRAITGRILKPNISTNGYYYVVLSKKGKVKTCYIHILMAETFLEKPNGYCEVDHINSDKLDNRINNIRLVSSRKENMNNSETRKKQKRGISKRRSYLSGENPNAQKIICTTTGEQFSCIKDFATKYNINYSTAKRYIKEGKQNIFGYGIVRVNVG